MFSLFNITFRYVNYRAPFDMNKTGAIHANGIGASTIQHAIDVARITEGSLTPTASAYLEDAIENIWSRILCTPGIYILSKDGLGLFNYFIAGFEGLHVAEQAIARYWGNKG
ncbi:hypothetical protein BDY17DRAFT_306255 [Neohortaea acidophila]|uniref:Uncharacterized protein n=1 Tax=Neohortaea acidophila TaxID=245834 RepID=A0A6A6PER4_9PEZI|nr:uncharacterized protein BDY17DRAFT_306255 [Neohortaea acidophila]KAF2478459.1 hypothetical protein BDY17DRAFT_306255 [Neohortaea acidophila]